MRILIVAQDNILLRGNVLNMHAKRAHPPLFATLTVSCIIAALLVGPRSAHALLRLSDPAHRIHGAAPSEQWELHAGGGDRVAELSDEEGAAILVDRMAITDLEALRRRPVSVLPGLWTSVQIRGVEAMSIGKQLGLAIAAEADHPFLQRVGAAAIVVPVGGEVVRVLGVAPLPRLAEILFVCRRIAREMRSVAPVHGSSVEAEADAAVLSQTSLGAIQREFAIPSDDLGIAVQTSAPSEAFFILDGRAGCPGVGRGGVPSTGDMPLFRAQGLAREGRTGAAKVLSESLVRRPGNSFAGLLRARLALEEGDVAAAKRYLAEKDAGSRFAAALRLRLLRLEGDAKAMLQEGWHFSDGFCGESGAMAAHEMGLAVQDEDPERASRLFLAAIEADPSDAAAYLSLGRVALGRGMQVREVLERLSVLLKKAPPTVDLQRLRERVQVMLRTTASSDAERE